jgi:hypothetical protein
MLLNFQTCKASSFRYFVKATQNKHTKVLIEKSLEEREPTLNIPVSAKHPDK